MVSGKFELPDEVTSHQLVEGKYSLAPLYKVSPVTRNGLSAQLRVWIPGFEKQNQPLKSAWFKVELNTELVCHVGVVAGERTPVITDRNPHLETLMDARRAVYLPHTEDANMVVDLPNMSGERRDYG